MIDDPPGSARRRRTQRPSGRPPAPPDGRGAAHGRLSEPPGPATRGAPDASERSSGGADPEEREDLEDLDELEFDPDAVSEPDGPAPRIVAFDIGEVLIDESRVWAVWSGLLGVSPLTFAAVLGAAIVQGEDHHAAFPHVAPNVDWQEFEDEHERRFGGFQEQDLYPDVRPCLSELRSLGFTVVLAGNQPARRTAQLRDLELPSDVVITSDELGTHKPDPAFFAEVLRVAGTDDPAEVLYVGDRIDNDVVPAITAGLRSCWLRRGPWGHLQDLPDEIEPDLVLEGLGELPLLLSGWGEDAGRSGDR